MKKILKILAIMQNGKIQLYDKAIPQTMLATACGQKWPTNLTNTNGTYSWVD